MSWAWCCGIDASRSAQAHLRSRLQLNGVCEVQHVQRLMGEGPRSNEFWKPSVACRRGVDLTVGACVGTQAVRLSADHADAQPPKLTRASTLVFLAVVDVA